jgi:hypothetical protein
MNCSHLQELTSWPCREVQGANGESVIVIAPPVPFWDGSTVPVYLIDRGDSIELTDDGALLQHLDASGFAVSSDGRRKRGLANALERWGVYFGNELHTMCRPEAIRDALQRFMGALFSAAHWEYDNAGKVLDNELLIAEAEMYLRALNPNGVFVHDVDLRGISGRRQPFPLKVDATYYDAVGAHPSSSASMVKKLADVRFVRENASAQISVIVEDRRNAERASADIQIFTQLAHVLRFSDLERRARDTLRHQ